MSQPSNVNPVGGSGSDEGRDGACTPEWLATLMGYFDLDPASNERSHVEANKVCILERGDDGLLETGGVGRFRCGGRYWTANGGTRVFCNPPYARGQVLRWVNHYRHTRFTFLLRYDPSTKWYETLLGDRTRGIIGPATHIWHPPERIGFEPPPGVQFTSNPFPHALYIREPGEDGVGRAYLGRLHRAGYLFAVDRHPFSWQSGQHEAHGQGTGSGDEGGQGTRAARGGGSGVREAGGGIRDGQTYWYCEGCGAAVCNADDCNCPAGC